jgi:hypothetical protein
MDCQESFKTWNNATNTVKPADNGTARGGICSVECMFLLIQVLEVKEPRSCENFPLKKGFRSLQVLLSDRFRGTIKSVCIVGAAWNSQDGQGLREVISESEKKHRQWTIALLRKV